MSSGLSPQARAWAIERVLSHVQDRYVEQLARKARTEEAAVKIVRRECVWSGGASPSGHRWHCYPEHVEVEYPDGGKGTLSWLEIVRAARATLTQAVMPI